MSEDEFTAKPAGDEEEDNDDRRENDPERDNHGARIATKPIEEIPKRDQYCRRVPQKMNPARYQRADLC